MTITTTSPSTPRLSDAARHLVVPSGIVATGWPRIRRRLSDMAIGFDPWQEGFGQLALSKRDDGKYAATVGGVMASIPRQTGKTFSVGSLAVAMCLEFPGLTVVWTAHRTRTATNTFRTLQGIVRRRRVFPHVDHVRTANGEQEIGFRNGSVIMFGAREQGFGRGFDEVDILVFDESQILTEKALDDMVAATNQSRHLHGALIFYLGTPPRPVDPGEVFSIKRDKALSGNADDLVYLEFSADPDADPDDRDQWVKANPSYPKRTPLESMLRLRENLLTDDAWLREALGIWVPEGSRRVIPADAWDDVADEDSIAVDQFALGIDVDPDRTYAAVSLAGQREDGCWHIELDEHRTGVGWLVPYVARLVEANPQIRAVVVDSASPAASLVNELTGHKIRPTTTTARDMANACGQLFDGVMEQWLRHIGQPQMSYSLSVARKRPLGDAWAWNRKDTVSDITPLVAATLALWGAQAPTVKRPTRKPRNGDTQSRRAVVL